MIFTAFLGIIPVLFSSINKITEGIGIENSKELNLQKNIQNLNLETFNCIKY